jgi:polyketide synthase 12/type I polyketide synthase AVES
MSAARHTGKMVLTLPPHPAARRPAGTVLVTGGTGMLGGLAGGYLARSGQAGTVVLASRSGPGAAGAAGLAARIAAAGSRVLVAACDVADRTALAGLLDGLPGPLTGVVHTAGVLDDATVARLTPARAGVVMAAKAAGAWNLHVLTRDRDLRLFVLYSSVAGVTGSAGQGSYAAANAFLDGLARARRAAGLPAVSLAWGFWEQASGMTGHLDPGLQARITRAGINPLTTTDGLALLDAALDRDEPVLVTARLDLPAITATGHPLWQHLTPANANVNGVSGNGGFGGFSGNGNGGFGGNGNGSANGNGHGHNGGVNGNGGGLAAQLAAMTPADQDHAIATLVRGHAAAVLGHPSADSIDPDRHFTRAGFDSLTAVELRNRLTAATGLTLSATLIFDHPTPTATARYLATHLLHHEPDSTRVLRDIDNLAGALSIVDGDVNARAKIITRLERIIQDFRAGNADNELAYEEIDDATDDEIFSLIDRELGI